MNRRTRLAAVAGAFVLVAAVVGGVVGWLVPWATGAIAAAGVAVVVLVAVYLRRQFADLRRRLNAQTREMQRAADRQRALANDLKAQASKLAATKNAVVASHKADMAEQNKVYRSLRTDLQKAADKTRTTVTRVNERTVKNERKFLTKTAALEGDRTRRHAERLFRQTEALADLHRLIEVRGAVAPSRGWALSPDVLLTYVEAILTAEPDTIVECGSGLSTIWAAYALEKLGGTGRVVALEHEEQFAGITRANLQRHGLTKHAEVRTAPLTDVEIDGKTWRWYAPSALDGLAGVGVVLVDGPPKPTGEYARYPALPMLRETLAPGAVVLLDDADRPDEKAIAQRWADEWPGATLEHLNHEKGTAVLRTPGPTRTETP